LYVFFSSPYVPVFKNKTYTNEHAQVPQVVDISLCTCVLYFLPSILLSVNNINNIADISKFLIMYLSSFICNSVRIRSRYPSHLTPPSSHFSPSWRNWWSKTLSMNPVAHSPDCSS
jgi:hypothetical protein